MSVREEPSMIVAVEAADSAQHSGTLVSLGSGLDFIPKDRDLRQL